MDKILVHMNDDERFDALCETLEMDDGPASLAQVAGHLHFWRAAWALDKTFEHGLLWDVPLSRFTKWAQWISPLKSKQDSREQFGRALLKHGYIKPVEDLFPPSVTKGRTGFCVMNPGGTSALDDAWNMHRNRQDAEQLVLCLLHPAKRAVRAYSLGWTESRSPAGFEGQPPWLMPLETAQAMLRGRRGDDDDAAGLSGSGVRPRGPDGDPPREFRGDTAAEPQRNHGGTSAVFPAVSPPTVLNSKERNQNYGSVNISSKRYTGTGKSEGLRQAMRETMYSDPLASLLLTDTGQTFQLLASRAVRANPEAVRQLIATMTEPKQWLSIRVPRPSVVFTKPLRLIAEQNGNGNSRAPVTDFVGHGTPHVERNGGGETAGKTAEVGNLSAHLQVVA